MKRYLEVNKAIKNALQKIIDKCGIQNCPIAVILNDKTEILVLDVRVK